MAFEDKYLELKDLLDCYQLLESVSSQQVLDAENLLDEMYAVFVDERNSIERSALIAKEQEVLSQIQRFGNLIAGNAVTLRVESISALKNLSPSDGTVVRVEDVGEYLWMDGDSTTADNALIIESTVDGYKVGDDNEGRWKLQYAGGEVPVEAFGAVGDGTTDDSTAITNAVTVMAGLGGAVKFSAKTYVVSSQIGLVTNKNISLIGSHRGGTVIKADSTLTSIFYKGGSALADRTQVHIQHMTIDCNYKADHGIWIEWGRWGSFRDIIVQKQLVSGIRMDSNGESGGSATAAGFWFHSVIVDGGADGISKGTITATADNGSGEIRVTSASHGLSTSDNVNVAGMLTDIGGRFTITKIDNDTFDLDGSTWSTDEGGNSPTWYQRPDYGIHLSDGATDNKLIGVTIPYAGLYGVYNEADHCFFYNVHPWGGTEYGFNIEGKTAMSGCYSDTNRYGIRIASQGVTVLNHTWFRNTTPSADPGKMTGVQFASGPIKGVRLHGTMEFSVDEDIDANGQTIGARTVFDFHNNAATTQNYPEPFNVWQPNTAGAYHVKFRQSDANSSLIGLSRNAGQVGGLDFQTDNKNRFRVGINTDAESGSDVGSNFVINSYDDTGVFKSEIMKVFRGTNAIQLSQATTSQKRLTAGKNLYGTVSTFSDADATPSVSDATFFKTANTSPTTITDFDDEGEGCMIWVLIDDANTTIQHGAGVIENKSGGNYTAQQLYHYVNVGGTWHEV